MIPALYGRLCGLLQEGVEKPIRWTVGDVTRKLRKRRRLSVAELAQRAGVNKSTVGSLERGTREPDTATVQKVADALDVSVLKLRSLVPLSVGPETRDLLDGMNRLSRLNPTALRSFRVAMLKAIDAALTAEEKSRS